MTKQEIAKVAADIARRRYAQRNEAALMRKQKKLLEELINDRSLNPIQVARAFSKETGKRVSVIQLGELLKKYGLC
ncbi:hypothetical protein [Nitrosococcus wardiae]|uniref:Uncharacterized protein n=1 Tax=Nitrosococcus wardiae TaxID=1814290 RepID=A0A4P7BZ87_9GAMM|nr:hypothetical protein [Nitrosococcus wardiae]QBQ55533.1 hypothetical protein E3U44_14205 [Nitrosococcus wardiae]